MNENVTAFLCCPCCKGELELVVLSRNTKGQEACVEQGCCEIMTGLLKCTCGRSYPIIDGVPRLLEQGLAAFPEFMQRYCPGDHYASSLTRSNAEIKKDDYEYIRSSFSKEWSIFDYDTDKTWGWTLEERKKIFADDVGLSPEQLNGKVVLDAGCGNGTLTATLAGLGMQVVGLDLSDGLGKANLSKHRYAAAVSGRTAYVQGNLFNPPLKQGSFDLIYSSGVLHHTPSTKATFKRLVPLLRDGGRIYVWVYSRRNLLVRMYMDAGRQLKKWLSPEQLLLTCRVMAPFYKVTAAMLHRLGVMEFRKRTVREITLDLFDAFAPQYNHRHTEDEVQQWFKEEGLSNIRVSGKQKHGFGVYGDRLNRKLSSHNSESASRSSSEDVQNPAAAFSD